MTCFFLFLHDDVNICSADLPMSFEDRVAAVGIATQFQERSDEVFRMVDEETETAKTQVLLNQLRFKGLLKCPFSKKWMGCYASYQTFLSHNSVHFLCLQIILAREYLKDVKITKDQLKYLVLEAMRGGCQVLCKFLFTLCVWNNHCIVTYSCKNENHLITRPP